jgi:hypothetical protein
VTNVPNHFLPPPMGRSSNGKNMLPGHKKEKPTKKQKSQQMKEVIPSPKKRKRDSSDDCRMWAGPNDYMFVRP